MCGSAKKKDNIIWTVKKFYKAVNFFPKSTAKVNKETMKQTLLVTWLAVYCNPCSNPEENGIEFVFFPFTPQIL